MDFLRVAAELTVPVLAGSLVGDEGKGKAHCLAGTFDVADRGFHMDALSAPQPEDESLIDTSSPYSQSEKRTETERRCEKGRCLG
jgi:hypothetical protein